MAINFDAVDDRINFGTLGDQVFTENGVITISAWIYPRSGGTAGIGRIVNRGSSLVSHGPRFAMTTTSTLSFQIQATTQMVRNSSNNSVTFNIWQHVLVTWTGDVTLASDVHIYVNGIETSYKTTTNGSSPATDNSTRELVIGNNSDFTRDFDGWIEEVAIWNVILTASEIAQLACPRRGTPLQIQPSSLQLYVPMDDFQDGVTASGANTIRDLSGNNRHGEPNNSPIGVGGRLTYRGRPIEVVTESVVTGIDTNNLDGKVSIQNLSTDNLDGKVKVKDISTLDLDAKVTVTNISTDSLDGKLVITNIVAGVDTLNLDGKIVLTGGIETVYMIYDAASNQLQVWMKGTKSAYFVP